VRREGRGKGGFRARRKGGSCLLFSLVSCSRGGKKGKEEWGGGRRGIDLSVLLFHRMSTGEGEEG